MVTAVFDSRPAGPPRHASAADGSIRRTGGGRIGGVVRAGAEQHWAWRERQRAGTHGAALVLGQLIEQMGGAPTSCIRGGYVNLRV